MEPLPDQTMGCGVVKVKAGDRYNRLVVIERDGLHAICACNCGNTKRIQANHLASGDIRSCGCLRTELLVQRSSKHNMCGTKEYTAWTSMKMRCNNPSDDAYQHYGGRGISVCPAWNDSFEEFYTHIGQAPSKDHTVDRIDNNGNYEPNNVRWATRKEQAINRRTTELVTIKGIRKPAHEWRGLLGIVQCSTFCDRKHKGWDTMRALLTKPRGALVTDEELGDILSAKEIT